MGSPLGLTWTNAFLVYVEINWLQNYPSDVKPHYYRLYVDDIFVLFTSSKHLEVSEIFSMRTYHLPLKIKSKTQCPFLIYRLFVEIKNLPLLGTANQHILTAFYHLTISLILSELFLDILKLY